MIVSKFDVLKVRQLQRKLMRAHWDKVMERIYDLRLRAGKRRLDGLACKPDTPPGDDLQ